MSLATVLVIIGYGTVRFSRIGDSWTMLKRMRWLFLSIFIVYLWFTPGHEILPVFQTISPTYEGLKLGLFRVYSLFLIVIGVNLLVRSIPRQDLICAILWLLKPFRIIGLPYERLAIRIALTFDFVGEAQTMFRSTPITIPEVMLDDDSVKHIYYPHWISVILKRLARIGDSAVLLFQNVLDKAAATECHNVNVPENNQPPVHQWFYVLVLMIFCFMTTKL